ncbi:MAG: (2Fe-2S)-binding protein [Azonexus sp.]|jgi:bacterioferritin-associated ferredoxin|nr:(2Fe-2S)-binding protein [Azonexus sp.]
MYVCVCQAVTDSQIREAMCEGVCSMRELRQRLGVASECGRCSRCALSILRGQQLAISANPPQPAVAFA